MSEEFLSSLTNESREKQHIDDHVSIETTQGESA